MCFIGTAKFKTHTDIPKPVDRDWGLTVSGTGNGLFVSPVDDYSALWSLSYRSAEPGEAMRYPLSPHKVEAIMNKARTLGQSFHGPLPQLLDHTDPSTLMVFNAMDRQAFAHDRAENPGGRVVFIGDSNHAVR